MIFVNLKLILLILSIIIIYDVILVLTSEEIEYAKFLKKYEKEYENEKQTERRFRIFRANLKKIRTLNSLEQGTAIYGITQFADLTKKEFRRNYLGLKKRELVKNRNEIVFSNVSLPKEFDWRYFNVVTPVKNQGMCGSCWAFSVTGNVEGQFAIKHDILLSFSEQELIDCDKFDAGCGGGDMTNGYKTIEVLGGLELEYDYPYQAFNEKCNFSRNKVKANVIDYINITSNEEQMAAWLVNNGPISIGLNANAMQFYFGGISHPWKIFCSPRDLDHGVLLVGFGVHESKFTHKNIPYWLVKNSWGASWGEKGYYRLYRGAGVCGMNKMATSSIVM